MKRQYPAKGHRLVPLIHRLIGPIPASDTTDDHDCDITDDVDISSDATANVTDAADVADDVTANVADVINDVTANAADVSNDDTANVTGANSNHMGTSTAHSDTDEARVDNSQLESECCSEDIIKLIVPSVS